MHSVEVKYRTWFKGIPPKPIKLEIPGWAGDSHERYSTMAGVKLQPWHCPPFVEANTYGVELLYPFDTECRVRVENGEVKYDCDFSKESGYPSDLPVPPFMSFPGHFGMTSCLDIRVPKDYVLRLEPHPRYYTDTTYTVPLMVPGHLQSYWWPKIFFVVFKQPMPGQTYIFRKGEPYGQAIVVPQKVCYSIKEMSDEEKMDRAALDNMIARHKERFHHSGHFEKGFDNNYKILSSLFAKGGLQAINEFLNESLQNQEATAAHPNVHSR